tara:strand:+ start:935 stop:1423 length:489 start_codon:yes stop_codon:yes gene_type:complete
MNRLEIANKIKQDKPIGAELGVASGGFSEQLINTNIFSHFYSIDKWNDHHCIKEYFNLLKKLNNKENIHVIRATFKEALNLFQDNYFDFIYIDGYAHTGQDNGTTLYDWYEKVKSGGVISGHDYHKKWPKTIECVDKFIKDKNLKLNLTNENEFPSWWCYKP